MDINKVKIGKSYQLRNGFTTLKVFLSGCGTNYKYQAVVLDEENKRTGYLFSWLDNGSYLTKSKEHKFDLIKEI